ncbi:MAG: D-sedoheptulose 7-phosphate isomerase [Pseudomonadota bacterium]
MLEHIFSQHREALALLEEQQPKLLQVAEHAKECLRNGGKILLMGNGGSAADAQHIAAELVGRFQAERTALAAIALTTDTSILTSVGNDYGFDAVFERQVQGLARSGDVVIGLSTSGNSTNVVRGVAAARKAGCLCVGFLGDAGQLGHIVDHAITLPGLPTARVQEMHILAGHILCELVDAEPLSGTGPDAETVS